MSATENPIYELDRFMREQVNLDCGRTSEQEYNYERATLPEQYGDVTRSHDSFSGHRVAARQIEGGPENGRSRFE